MTYRCCSKGQTAASSYKPAILDNGIKIQVPPFVENGDEIITIQDQSNTLKSVIIMNSISPHLNIMIKAWESLKIIRDFGELENLQVKKGPQILSQKYKWVEQI